MKIFDATHALTTLDPPDSPAWVPCPQDLRVSQLWRDTLSTVSWELWLQLPPRGNPLPTPPRAGRASPLCAHSDEHGGALLMHLSPPAAGTPRASAASCPPRASPEPGVGWGGPCAPLTFSLLTSASLGQPKSSRLRRLPSYSRKVR